MSVLSDHHIGLAIERGRIGVDPFEPALIQPASLDVRLGDHFVGVDGSQHFSYTVERVSNPGAVDGPFIDMERGQFLLATTVEWVKIPRDLVARLEGKSSWGRRGLIVHATAGYVDPGFQGELTLELHALVPVTIPIGCAIAQLSFHELTSAAEHPYAGKYQGQRGATRAR